MEEKQIAVIVSYAKPTKQQKFTTALNLQVGDKVVVETVRGIEIGEVESITDKEAGEDLKKVMRIATQKDLKTNEENKKKAKDYLVKTKQRIIECGLEMKLISAEFTLDFSKIILTFTAEGRVDFRELVKKLAGDFKMKIELRQVGPRDAVQALGAIGFCGKECCCIRKTNILPHVSMKMAKNQGLPLNPVTVSGLCGKLLCCLGYENNQYKEILSTMPKVNSEVTSPDGKGKVIFNDLFHNLVTVRLENTTKKYSPEELDIQEYASIIKEEAEDFKDEE